MLRFLSRSYRFIKRSIFLRSSVNSPFMSGDSFAEITDYLVYGKDKNSRVDERKLLSARSLFIPGDKFSEFLEGYASSIRAKVLIIGNSDQNFDSVFQVPHSVTLVLVQNSTISDSTRIFTLPIGLENRRLGRAGNPRLYQRKSLLHTQANKVYVPPMSPTNPIRKAILSELEQCPNDLLEVDKKYVEIHKYIEKVKNYKFILCLEGNGYENHRIWEALYLGLFPVVLETKWSLSLKYLGLPILFIHSIEEINQELLSTFATTHAGFSPSSTSVLWIPYWKAWIESHY